VVAALVVLVSGPAAIVLKLGRFGTQVLWYYLAVGLVAAGAVALRLVDTRTFRGRRGRVDLADLPPLGLPRSDPGEHELAASYPEHRQAVAVLHQAIETGNRVRFRYRKDDGSNQQRAALPRYLHEYRRSGNAAASLCLNAYYNKSRRNENFAVARMSEIEIFAEES
jgi:hypothetical protein